MDQDESNEEGHNWVECEALTESFDWFGSGERLQCSRMVRTSQPDLCDLWLCYQHVDKARRYDRLELIENRTLELEQVWSDDGWRRIFVSAKVIHHEPKAVDKSPAPVIDIADYRRKRR